MDRAKNEIAKTFHEISQTALWDSHLPISFDEYDALLSSESTEALLEMLECEDDATIQRITMEELLKAPFAIAKKTIERFSLAKRIDILKDAEERRSYLYNQASRYGAGNPFDPNQLSPKDWRTMMGRIKHLEILVAWLYGID